MAHFEIYLESSGNFIAGGADLISISDLLSRELCVRRADLYCTAIVYVARQIPKMSCNKHTGNLYVHSNEYMKKV